MTRHDEGGGVLLGARSAPGVRSAWSPAWCSWSHLHQTRESWRQIGMLKLIGAPDRTIVAMIVPQALALGMSGFVSAPC